MPSIVGGMYALRAAVEEPSEGINRGEIREVEFRFIIEADGSFTNPQLVQSSSVPSVDRAVLNGLRSVEWEPGTENGEPVRLQITMPIERYSAANGIGSHPFPYFLPHVQLRPCLLSHPPRTAPRRDVLAPHLSASRWRFCCWGLAQADAAAHRRPPTQFLTTTPGLGFKAPSRTW